jgi:polyisoprenoid-binding protein YceI
MKILFVTVLALSQIAYAKDAKVEAPAKVAASTSFKSTPAQGEVAFEAVGKPSFLKIKGKGEGPEGEVKIDSGVQGTFKFKMASLETGISMRDTHMKEKYLQVDKFPMAELKIEGVEKFDPNKAEEAALPFKGTLTLHGVTKPVTGQVDIKKKGNGFSVKAQFDTKITDFAIDIPSYSGITVADAVKVSVETDLM